MSPYQVELVELQSQPTVFVRGHVETAGIPGFLGTAFGEVMQLLDDQHLTPAGPPFARFRPVAGEFDVEVGFPSAGSVRPAGRVEAGELPGGSAASVLHRGDYGAVGAAYEFATEWLDTNGYVTAGEPWESYLDGPEVAEPRTLVRFPCRLA
jgi:hypothetical protein